MSVHTGKFTRIQDSAETSGGYFGEKILHGTLTFLHNLQAEALTGLLLLFVFVFSDYLFNSKESGNIELVSPSRAKGRFVCCPQ